MEKIRNNITFHYKKKVYEDIITDGPESEDLRVAITKSNKIIDCRYTLPYDITLSYVESIIPEEVEGDALEWVADQATQNADDFAVILEKIAGKIIKANGYKKSESNVID